VPGPIRKAASKRRRGDNIKGTNGISETATFVAGPVLFDGLVTREQ
jgi:hypothetical protein